MMCLLWYFYLLFLSAHFVPSTALRYDLEQVRWNLNQNKTAIQPVDYWGEWKNHTYHPSPINWRFPFYALTLDRYVDGDPSNNQANGTVFEHSWTSTQFRFGGDTKGLSNDLDYIQGMGIKGIYLTGSPFINMPWAGDGYGPLDFTLLDHHHGDIEDWRMLITKIHKKGMYVILDNTMATMGDLIAMKPYVNASVPFDWKEHDYVWKGDRRYHDFQPSDTFNASCKYPRMWGQDGYPVVQEILDQQQHGCKSSEFDLYGDIKGTGAYPSWQDELSKFASVQDRLREWNHDVFKKIERMSCIQISMFDIDGFRMDKGLQTTPDAMATFASSMRECARKVGKDNFLINGEIVGAPGLAAVFVGRGKQPNQYISNVTDAMLATNETDPSMYIRPFGKNALDGSAFHYDIYGALTRFLGLDGPWGSHGVDWVEWWTRTVQNHDMVNANTGKYDPRHMIGMTDQDVFRWPSLSHGIQRQLLGWMVTILEIPGIPIFLFGEEQAYYVLENLADDYVFGRNPMSSSRAWQMHGCYKLGETVYTDLPFDSARHGCEDDTVSLDHRDPSHPVRNVLKRMLELRQQYPVLNDGFNLTTLSTKIYNIYLKGSGGLPSPHGIWSVHRGRTGVQDFTGEARGNQGVWFVYHNENHSVHYNFDCESPDASLALISAFPAGKTVKNLFYPYEEYVLEASTIKYGIEDSNDFNGCLPQLEMPPWGWKVLVPIENWQVPSPTITRFLPGHDTRLHSTVSYDEQESIPIQIRFSSAMSCDSVTKAITLESTTTQGQTARLNASSIVCFIADADLPQHVGEIATAWIFSARLDNVYNGVHRISVNNASTEDRLLFTGAVDRFIFRIGQTDNPVVFASANYTKGIFHKEPSTGMLTVAQRAAGADKWRYSLNWGSTYSEWFSYTERNVSLIPQPWSGTKLQEWTGDHVILHYWSAMTGSSDHVQHADLDDYNSWPRRWPHVFTEGSWNQYGYDSGLANQMRLDSNGFWEFRWMADWPTQVIVNVWGMNPDGAPDKSAAFGDVDGDGVLDWLPPDSLAQNVINFTNVPTGGCLGFELLVNDADLRYYVKPTGSATIQMVVAIVIGLVPIITGILGIYIFQAGFYGVKFNETGLSEKSNTFVAVVQLSGLYWTALEQLARGPKKLARVNTGLGTGITKLALPIESPPEAPPLPDGVAEYISAWLPRRRTVLIATLEYEIEDWKIKVKIGGLGVMSTLMGKHLVHLNLIWVVPCINDINYPIDRVAEDIKVEILGETYRIKVQYHTVGSITFVLLDAPVFRKRTKAEPYPPRMDDLDSAIYYSAWNQCVAEALRRFDVDLYHINDYHATVAPLYLLPSTIPSCLSLHNAEFQGMWSLKSKADMVEICQIFNLPSQVVASYVQFGEVFNLLHAGASILRINQNGFGSVGVSKKYGKRAYARYPIFWGLTNIGALPNPDPSDFAAWDKMLQRNDSIHIDNTLEAGRGALRIEAQQWAGLNEDPEAELFVFVGRWSMQKGVDLIADVFFSVLTDNPKVQLIAIGPVIDLYGKFAALKLAKLMIAFPGRVCSKPVFTQLPPCVFSGAEFALIPSRDEPFGLVAVEFGRKGALGVGSRVGGLGQMPGWWFTVESATTKHMLRQFKMAIRAALASNHETRTMMRARSLLQRFPVAQWMEDLEILQSTSIKLHDQNKLLAARNTPLKAVKRKVSEMTAVATVLINAVSKLISTQTRAINLGLRPLEPRDSTEGQSQRRRETLSERGRRASDVAEAAFALDLRHLRIRPPIIDEYIEEEDEGEETMEFDLNREIRTPAVITEISEAKNEDDQKFQEFFQTREMPSTAEFNKKIEGKQDENDGSIQARTNAVESRDLAPGPMDLRQRHPGTTGIFEDDEKRGEYLQDDSNLISRISFAIPVSNLILPKSNIAQGPPSASQKHGEIDSSHFGLPLTAFSSWSSKHSARLKPVITATISKDEDGISPTATFDQTISSTVLCPTSTQGKASSPLANSILPLSESRQRAQKPPSAFPIWSGPFSPEMTVYRPHEGAAAGWVDNYETTQVIFAIPSTPSHLHRHGSHTTPQHSEIGGQHGSKYRKSSFALHLKEKRLSLAAMVGGRKDFRLQKVEPFFTDSTVFYYEIFRELLEDLDARSSEHQLCIENFLVKSERQWFGRFHRAKLGQSAGVSGATAGSCDSNRRIDLQQSLETVIQDEFNLEEGFIPPKGLKRFLQRKLGDWQVYCVFLAFGQIMAANSYQITLLTGARGESADKLYVIASVYLVASGFWWYLYRRAQAIYVLSCPFFLYGVAFFLVGMAPFLGNLVTRGWMYNIATAIYAMASASGSFFFALNFGTEGGTPSTFWIFRACVIQGTQNIYVSMLWWWGNELTRVTVHGATVSVGGTPSKITAAITTPVALLLFVVGYLIYFGLPSYYRQTAGNIPSFYHSIFRRKIVLWFLVMIVLQNYWFSAQYGRNWSYLWSSAHVPRWAIAILVVVYFIIVWSAMLWILGWQSTKHSWVMPIFAISLGAPRWCQMFWGVSGIALYVPWGSRITGALLGRSLWLWLGVLDAVQGVGFGMMLLQTLSRFHVIFTLIAGQVVGSAATILARATAPNKTGPGAVFPNFALGLDGLSNAWFWLCVLSQLLIVLGFTKYFRKEQMFKP